MLINVDDDVLDVETPIATGVTKRRACFNVRDRRADADAQRGARRRCALQGASCCRASWTPSAAWTRRRWRATVDRRCSWGPRWRSTTARRARSGGRALLAPKARRPPVVTSSPMASNAVAPSRCRGADAARRSPPGARRRLLQPGARAHRRPASPSGNLRSLRSARTSWIMRERCGGVARAATHPPARASVRHMKPRDDDADADAAAAAEAARDERRGARAGLRPEVQLVELAPRARVHRGCEARGSARAPRWHNVGGRRTMRPPRAPGSAARSSPLARRKTHALAACARLVHAMPGEGRAKGVDRVSSRAASGAATPARVRRGWTRTSRLRIWRLPHARRRRAELDKLARLTSAIARATRCASRTTDAMSASRPPRRPAAARPAASERPARRCRRCWAAWCGRRPQT